MFRQPLVAALTAASLIVLAGCGANQMPTSAAAKAAQATAAARAVLIAEEKAIDAAELKPEANKDWQVIEGKVTKLLPDDLQGLRHQHFLVQVGNKTVKVAHNIDLAPYVPVKVGDEVEMKCEYIRSKPNDVAHWTHYDPAGGEGGYIKLNGKVYDRLAEDKK